MRWIGYVNFFGVLALAVLFTIQWQRNSRLNFQLIDLEKTRQEQAQKIADDATAIKNVTSDLDDFRNRLQAAEDELKNDDVVIAKLRVERDNTIVERDRAVEELAEAKAALVQWEQAVKERDDALKKASDEITKLAKDHDDTVAKFNDLAGKYNGLLKDLNDARAKLAAAH